MSLEVEVEVEIEGGGSWGTRYIDVASGVRQRRQRMVDCVDDEEGKGGLDPVVRGESDILLVEWGELGLLLLLSSLK